MNRIITDEVSQKLPGLGEMTSLNLVDYEYRDRGEVLSLYID